METLLSSGGRQAVFPIDEASQIAAVRRGGSDIARKQGLDETLTGKVAIAITEAATNILKHAGHGEILLRPLTGGDAAGVEIIALDKGAGIVNLGLNMQDGVSSSGTYGVGLGAMRRMADEFDIFTGAGLGTVVYMALWNRPQDAQAGTWQAGSVCLPLAGEEVCGDAWVIASDPTTATVMVADGLGHGVQAAQASEAAIDYLAAYPDAMPETALWESHAALRATRGAAIAVARIDTRAEELRFCGVGNIAASAQHASARRQLVSHNGIVGSNMRKVQEFSLEWLPGTTLIMHSDGLGTRWQLDQYPGLALAHPGLIAAVLYRDFARGRDDVTVLVLRERTLH
ncbi:ATP-binding SpoIIE family protein phosphatase [Noviherbaspirillum sp. CPCC 100848]|uniref:ATP-binding SpoIIE family protein phosphatase n=1 Tax=Noviherbaspirillum album TaxID=3080276 RepID=A0ABU6J371_9BURK|nr:ATP-binding SpoIIE family protein phosphatase [Noviherbaspirillum sp. CPCC 100848]MEC4717876.1 ATP-binding SpoIIE family protein phosphatase [Noviherbaspirillum sp. CPCC 100848]